MKPISPRLQADAAMVIAKPRHHWHAIAEFAKMRTGGPRIHRQDPVYRTDPNHIADLLRYKEDHELRGSSQGPEAQAQE